MKKHLIFYIAILASHLSFSNTVNDNAIQLPKHYKAESTFSGDLSDKTSFHLLFTKNRKLKNYEVFSYLFDGEKIIKLPSLINKKAFNLVSFHKNKNTLSLLLSYSINKKSFIRRVDYNLTNNNKIDFKAVSHEDFSTSIRTKNKSILVYKTDDFFRVIIHSKNANSIKKELPLNKDSDVKKFFNNSSVTSIKTDEFVKNGATNKIRLYYQNNNLVFTRDSAYPLSINGFSLINKKANVTQVLKINLKDTILSPKFSSFENAIGKNYKKGTSYILDNKLFQLGLSKKSGIIKISDIHTGKPLKTISLDNSIATYIKGNSEFQGIEKFLKNAGRNKYNVTITANKTKTNLIRVRLDYVDITYSYNYNWWWHHQQFMWHMQQNSIQNFQRNIPTGFGPRIIDDYAFESATVLEEKRFFEIVIDDKGNLQNIELPISLYKVIDKKKFIDKLEDISNLSLQSSCFLKDSFRFIAYDKNTKKFIIQSNKL